MRLIIIEDELPFAELVAFCLRGLTEGEPFVTDDWQKAMEVMDNSDVAWVDLRMPKSGEQDSILRIADVRKRNQKIVIIVGSGFISPHVRAQLDQAGIDACYYKGGRFDARQMASVVMLGLMKAAKRDVTFNMKLLSRALEWMHERYPDTAAA